MNISFHREFVGEDEFVEKLHELRKLARFHINVNLVATRENLPAIPKIKELLTDNSITLHIDPFVGADLAFSYTAEEQSLLRPYLPPDRRAQMARLDFGGYARSNVPPERTTSTSCPTARCSAARRL